MAKHRKPSRRARRPAVAALLASLLVTALLAFVAGTFVQVAGGARTAADGDVLSVARECQQALGYPARTAEDIDWLTKCEHALRTPAPDPTPSTPPTPTPTATPSASPTPAPTPTATPVPSPTTPAPSPTQSPTPTPTSPAWPGPDNTGVPAGTTLTAYTGPCRITQANTVIDAKVINCTITVAAPGLVISRSRVNGSVTNGSGGGGPSFGLVDSEVIAAAGNTGVGESNFTLLRVEISGGNRSAHCYDTCIVADSWLHGQRLGTASQHASGLRMGANLVATGNTLACDVADTSAGGGCSAPLTGYGDFNAVVNNLVQGNLFVATPGGTCAYGGASGGKPFSSQSGFNVDFIDNTFQRGSGGKCGFYAPVLDWRRHATNTWANNRFVDGVVIAQP